MASLNSKVAAQIKDKIRAEEQKLLPFVQAEEDLFSKIEDECIRVINKLYKSSGFVEEAPLQGLQ